jgi:hypothetical protein
VIRLIEWRTEKEKPGRYILEELPLIELLGKSFSIAVEMKA